MRYRYHLCALSFRQLNLVSISDCWRLLSLLSPVRQAVKFCRHLVLSKGGSNAFKPFLRRKTVGRSAGAKNYTHDEVTVLLDAVEPELPLGQQMWAAVAEHYDT